MDLPLEHSIDHYIKQQYHAICFNPAKKDTLLHLTIQQE